MSKTTEFALKFKELRNGDTFDFVDDNKPETNSFFRVCRKIGPRRYCEALDPSKTYMIGTTTANVYHVNERQVLPNPFQGPQKQHPSS